MIIYDVGIIINKKEEEEENFTCIVDDYAQRVSIFEQTKFLKCFEVERTQERLEVQVNRRM